MCRRNRCYWVTIAEEVPLPPCNCIETQDLLEQRRQRICWNRGWVGWPHVARDARQEEAEGSGRVKWVQAVQAVLYYLGGRLGFLYFIKLLKSRLGLSFFYPPCLGSRPFLFLAFVRNGYRNLCKFPSLFCWSFNLWTTQQGSAVLRSTRKLFRGGIAATKKFI